MEKDTQMRDFRKQGMVEGSILIQVDNILFHHDHMVLHPDFLILTSVALSKVEKWIFEDDTRVIIVTDTRVTEKGDL